jgi:hypothetical protein
MIPLLVSANLLALSNLEVAQKSEAVMNGFKDATSTMEMTLVNAHGQKKVRKMRSIVLENPNSDDGDKSLMEFLSPADVKGTKFLSYEHITKDDDQWLYLPALKRVKRIASRNKSGAFMGSEFSYEDLSSFNLNKYSYSGDAKEIVLDGVKMYESTRIPVSKTSGYTQQISFVDAQTFLASKVDYYDRKSELLKTATFSDYKKISGVWRIGKIEMKNHQNDKATVLVWSNEKVGVGLKSKDFHKRVLKR